MKNDNRNFDFDRFSFRRVGVLLKKRYVITRRSMMLQIAVVFGVLLIAVFGALWLQYFIQNPLDISYGFSAAVLFFAYMVLMSFATSIGASMTFGGLRTKSERAITLMEPATVGERMLSDSLFSIVIPPIAVTIVYLLAECLRMNLATWFFGQDKSIFSLIDQGLKITEMRDIVLIAIVGMVMQQSFYLLGSIVWPRLSFLKTFAVMQIMAYVMMTVVLVICIFNSDFFFVEPTINPTWIIVGSSIVFTVANFIIAYYRYRQIEIIQRW